MSERKFGEFKCKECGKIFFQKRLLDCHTGSHKRGYTGKPKCKKCGCELNKKTWLPSLEKSSNLLCRVCLRKRNSDSYKRKKQRKIEEIKQRKNKCD